MKIPSYFRKFLSPFNYEPRKMKMKRVIEHVNTDSMGFEKMCVCITLFSIIAILGIMIVLNN